MSDGCDDILACARARACFPSIGPISNPNLLKSAEPPTTRHHPRATDVNRRSPHRQKEVDYSTRTRNPISFVVVVESHKEGLNFRI